MKRVLVAVALATLMIIAGTAHAADTASCGAALGVHNNASCVATDTLTWGGEPSLDIAVGIGPVEDIFSGDIQVNIANTNSLDTATAILQKTCVFRVDNGWGLLGSVCINSSVGEFTPGETVYCIGRGSGIGQWAVTCSIPPLVG
jgi:hypothetical protein